MSLNVLRSIEGFGVRVGNVALESATGCHILQVGLDKRVSQQGFREEDDEAVRKGSATAEIPSCRSDLRFAEVSVNLPAQNVEVVAGCSHVHDLHVAVLDLTGHLFAFRIVVGVIVAKLEEPFDTRGRVFGPLTIVAVRQRKCETRSLQPFPLARADELVDHDLRAVGEVAD